MEIKSDMCKIKAI